MIYDGDCGLCRRWAARWRRFTGDRVAYVPFQRKPDGLPLSLESLKTSLCFVGEDGKAYRAAEAVCRLLACVPGWGWPLRLYRRWPWAARAGEALYRFVARHRDVLSRCGGPLV